jgi:type VI secretion system protein ImpE
MNASELFKAGQLGEAIDVQLKEVKAHPADQARRLFLFEMLSFNGELDRARKQADAIRYDDVELEAAIATYRMLIDAEMMRRRVFEEGAAPRSFGTLPDHAQLRLGGAHLLREGRPDEARETFLRAASISPAVSGRLNGRPFATLVDCDDVFGSVLEVIVRGEYYWVPLEQVQSLTMGPPRFPRDLIWAPAQLDLADLSGPVFLPVLYPGSHQHPDDRVKLGRLTEWKHSDADLVIGVGSHLFQADDEEVGLLEWRELRLGEGEGKGEGEGEGEGEGASPEPSAEDRPETDDGG